MFLTSELENDGRTIETWSLLTVIFIVKYIPKNLLIRI